MFGEIKQAKQVLNLKTKFPIYRLMISNLGHRKENRMFEALAEFAIFRWP